MTLISALKTASTLSTMSAAVFAMGCGGSDDESPKPRTLKIGTPAVVRYAYDPGPMKTSKIEATPKKIVEGESDDLVLNHLTIGQSYQGPPGANTVYPDGRVGELTPYSDIDRRDSK